MALSRKRPPAVRSAEEISAAANEQLIFQQRIVSRSGPLPDPETLRVYEDLLPGASDRIFRMAEKDQNFVHTHQMRGQSFAFWTKTVGQIFGFLLGVTALIGCIYLAAHDKSFAGAVLFLGAVGTLIGTAVWASSSKSTEKKQTQGN